MTKLVIVPTVSDALQKGLAVTLLRDVAHQNHTFLSGHTYGFAPESAMSLVLNGAGRPRLFDEGDAKRWTELAKSMGEDVLDALEAIEPTGPYVAKLAERAADEAELEQLALASLAERSEVDAATAERASVSNADVSPSDDAEPVEPEPVAESAPKKSKRSR